MKKPKVVFLTGCSRGIGYALALHLAKFGYIVYATVKDLKNSNQLLRQSKRYPNLKIRKLDVTNEKDIEAVVSEIITHETTIDILINNAAYILFGAIETLGIEQIKKQFDVNVFGMIRTTQAVLPYMRKSKSGHIIFIGSTSGIHCSAMYGAYSATKFALEAIAYALAINLYPWNIQVSIIENGATNTKICQKSTVFGNRFKKSNDPYKGYTKKSFTFLKNILTNGISAKSVARSIEDVIKHPQPFLRYFPSKRSENIFSNHLLDPHGEECLVEAQEEYISLFKEKA